MKHFFVILWACIFSLSCYGQVTFGGEAALGYRYTNNEVFQRVPMFEARLSPKIILKKLLPFSADLTYLRYSDNSWRFNATTVRFDVNQLKSTLMQMVTDKLNEMNKEVQNYVQTQKEKLSFDSLYNSPEVQKKLADYQYLKNAKNYIDSLSQSIPDSIKTICQNIYYARKPEDCPALQNYLKQSIGDSSLTKYVEDVKNIRNMEWSGTKPEWCEKLLGKKKELEEKYADGKHKIDSLKREMELAKGMLTDYRSILKSLGLPKYLEFLTFIKSLEIGTSTPSFSEFTSYGTRILGAKLGLGLKNTSLTGYYGNIVPTVDTLIKMPAPKKRSFGLQFMEGNQSESFVKINYVQSKDIKMPEGYVGGISFNEVVGAETQLSLFKKHLTLNGELAFSYTMPDRNAATTSDGEKNNWFQKMFSSDKINEIHGRAVKAEAVLSFWDGTTVLKNAYREISTGFESYNAPFILKGIRRFESKLTQKIWKKRIELSAALRHNRPVSNNNWINRSKTTSYYVSAQIAIPKLPFARVSFSPMVLQRDSTTFEADTWTAQLNYNLKTKSSVSHNFSALANIYKVTLAPEHFGFLGSQNFSFQYTLSLSSKNSFSIGGNYDRLFMEENNQNILACYVGTNSTIAKKWNNDLKLGFTYSDDFKPSVIYSTALKIHKSISVTGFLNYSRMGVSLSSINTAPENFLSAGAGVQLRMDN